eukprot:gb/GEZN01009718.1/.p1 GENE.gb/GEZN01009718.1/~~gb/GEZN01009718.1/.p1  ORF type:complete len:258 (-),score=30.79 gb/GEZN01009718.1/:85-858(-)
MIEALKMEDAMPVSVPWLPNGQLPTRPSVLEQFSPHVIMGNLITFRGTRPDIRAVVSELAENQSKPDQFNFMGAEQVIRYINGTKTKGIVFRSDAEAKIGKCGFDSSHVPKKDLRSRMGGYFTLMGGDVDDFSTKIKNATPLSTCESETYGGSEAIRRALVLRNVIEAFGPNQVFDTWEPVVLECDNEAVVKNFRRSVFGHNLAHIELRHRFVNQAIKQGKVKVIFVRTDEQYADIFTKPLMRVKFQKFASLLVQDD